jgi:tetratricopeptide (TPR) repeat protein
MEKPEGDQSMSAHRSMKKLGKVLLAAFLGLLLAPQVALADAANSYRLSYQQEAKGDYASALARMREIRKAEGASYFVALRSGWLAYLSGDNAAAETGYREAIAAKPRAIEAKIGLTLVLYVAQKWKELDATCKQVLAEDGKNPVVRARMAAGNYGSGNYTDAAVIYRKLVEEYPGELDYQTGYAWALQRMGKREEAQKLFQAVLAVSPDNLNANQGMSAK